MSKHFGETLSPDDAYLSYHDVRLTREDVCWHSMEGIWHSRELTFRRCNVSATTG